MVGGTSLTQITPYVKPHTCEGVSHATTSFVKVSVTMRCRHSQGHMLPMG